MNFSVGCQAKLCSTSHQTVSANAGKILSGIEKAHSKQGEMLKDTISRICAFIEQFIFLIKLPHNSPDTIQQLLVATS